MKKFLNTMQPHVLSVMRIVAAFLFMQHGGQKLFGFPGSQRHGFELFSLMGAAGILELFGGALLLVGLFTRPVAFVLSGMMGVAYFMAHAKKNFWPILNGGELAIMFCFAFFYLAFAGGGSWSFDRFRSGNK